MIEHLGQPISNPPSDEHPNAGTSDAKIDGILRSEPILNGRKKISSGTSSGASNCLNRNLNQVKTGLKAVVSENKGNPSQMGGVLLACDARPHPLCTTLLVQKSVVGSGLSAHLSAHVANDEIKNIYQNKKTNPKPKSKNKQNKTTPDTITNARDIRRET